MWLSPRISLETKRLVNQAKCPQGVKPESEQRGVLSCCTVDSEGEAWFSVQGLIIRDNEAEVARKGFVFSLCANALYNVLASLSPARPPYLQSRCHS